MTLDVFPVLEGREEGRGGETRASLEGGGEGERWRRETFRRRGRRGEEGLMESGDGERDEVEVVEEEEGDRDMSWDFGTRRLGWDGHGDGEKAY